jgi:hypothetical protein
LETEITIKSQAVSQVFPAIMSVLLQDTKNSGFSLSLATPARQRLPANDKLEPF